MMLAPMAFLVALTLSRAAAADDGVLVLQSVPAPRAELKDLLAGDDELWKTAPEQPLHLNRTPPLYADGPYDDGERPEAIVRTFRMRDGSLMVHIRWTDATQDLGPTAERRPEAGEKHIYKSDSEAVQAFGDAVCVMAPQSRGPHDVYPSLMMGDDVEPVDLYYWRAGEGFLVLGSHGRAKTEQVLDGELTGESNRLEDGWSVVMVLPDITPGTPLCFAIWDGAKDHRDGVKYFSLWHEAQ